MTHVLLVEDDVDTRALVRELLIRRGHEVDACATALDALRLFRERPYPLVVTDWLMPGIDGLQLTREIRKLDGGEWCVVVVVTARQEVGDLQTVLDAGADDYVTKPFEISYLNVRLEVAERRVAETSRRRAAESAAEASRSSLERSRNDLLAILDLMRVAIAMVDAAGAVTFLSKAAETLLGVDRRSGSGSFWSDVLPLPESVVARVQEVAALPESERPRLEAAIVRRGLALQLEIEVRDDPRGLASRILFLYDVTERNELQQMLRDRQRLGQIIAKSRPMLEVFRLIGELAKVDTTVLILGETGTGKELAARAIHEASDRCEKPFVAVNCAGLTESLLGSQLFGHRRGAFTGAISDQQGMFEAAEGGT
ncbi:MAG: sigma 54-interacting transcriptional regulator, partial [Myxococcales bacterium]|nr:sigma 54-interacting transcriptional regulator [Myxococcales bacterium]